MEGRSLTEDEMEAKFTALKEEFFQDLEIKLGKFGEELVKNQSVIQRKIQAQISNLHYPPISHHGSFLLIYPTLQLKHIA